MFDKFIINYQTNPFEELSNATKFEDVTTGRKGAILVDNQNGLIPIVRSTTVYHRPVQNFLPPHYNIINNIKDISKCPQLEFNNALIEVYDHRYQTMGFHSDQALDLEQNSYICIFSCYDNPTYLRKLKIKEKSTKKCFEIVLDQYSFILFPLSTNGEHLHKIVLEENSSNNKWLGITFRLSKTFIQFIDKIPYFYPSLQILKTASPDDRKEYFKHRSNENKSVKYTYPEINYTISASDMLEIELIDESDSIRDICHRVIDKCHRVIDKCDSIKDKCDQLIEYIMGLKNDDVNDVDDRC